MKVDLVIPGLQIGGAERQVVGFARELRAQGIDVRLVSLGGSGPMLADWQGGETFLVELDGGRDRFGAVRILSVARSLWSYWRIRKPDAVQAWLPEAQVIALPVAKLLRIPCRIINLRSLSSAVRMSSLRRAALRLAALCSTAVVGNSRAVVEDSGWPTGGLPKTVVPNGLGMPVSTASVSVEPPRGVVVANMTSLKGHSRLLKALSLLESPPRVDLVGDGALRTRIEGEIRDLGLSERVEVHTQCVHPEVFLLRSQFFILPSLSEGLPNSLMEAMAFGLPAVAFKVGGVPELINDGVTGILVEDGDLQGFAGAIQWVADNPKWRMRAGSAARQDIARYAWPKVLQLHLSLMKP